MNILEINDLHKAFGTNQVLKGLNLEVPEHAVFGFVGRNGSGKTTTMKIVLGLLKPDGGTVTVCGEKVSHGSTRTNRHVGYLPETPEFYAYMRPVEYLRLCGQLSRLSPRTIEERSRELLERVGLAGINRKIGGFSRGMKQRLGLAQALLHQPRLLICDEPSSALDPPGRRQILELLSGIREKTTVIFSTHILSDVERICDRVALLEDGIIAFSGSLADIQRRHPQNNFRIQFKDPAEARQFMRLEPLRQGALDLNLNENVLTVGLADEEAGGGLLIRLLAETGTTPERFELLESSLESLFSEVAP